MRTCCLLVVLCTQGVLVLCRVFERCELMRELSRKKHRIPAADLATWVCIARHESQFNTSAVGNLNADGSGDHGLFQISDQYWCSPPGVGMACGLNCDQLEDDDIADDVVCARRIYRVHKRRTGDGFTAWAVYGPHCRGDNTAFTRDCDLTTPQKTTEKPSTTTTTTTSLPASSSTTESPVTDEGSSVSSSTTDNTLGEEGDVVSDKPSSTDIESPEKEPVSRSGASARHFSRLSQTSSPWNPQPGTSYVTQDPLNAWLNIHYDPRFLDEFA